MYNDSMAVEFDLCWVCSERLGPLWGRPLGTRACGKIFSWELAKLMDRELGIDCSKSVTPWRGWLVLGSPVRYSGKEREGTKNTLLVWQIISISDEISSSDAWTLLFFSPSLHICSKHLCGHVEVILSICWLIPFPCKSFIIVFCLPSMLARAVKPQIFVKKKWRASGVVVGRAGRARPCCLHSQSTNISTVSPRDTGTKRQKNPIWDGASRHSLRGKNLLHMVGLVENKNWFHTVSLVQT